MKKKILILSLLTFAFVSVFAQTNSTIDLGDEVYSFLTICEQKNYCEKLSNVKPYTEHYVISLLHQVKQNLLEKQAEKDSKLIQSELKTTEFYLSRYDREVGLDFKRFAYRLEAPDAKLPFTLEVNNSEEVFSSSGFYNDSSLNSSGFDIYHNINFSGDLGKSLSYRMSAFFGLSDFDMKQLGDDYLIGYWWYDDWDGTSGDNPRYINTFKNYAVLPYSYKKPWDGSVYYLSNLTHSGLEGWPFVLAGGFGIYGELRTSFFDDAVTIGAGRINHEWAAMDERASLVLNENAAPFFGLDAKVNLGKHVSFSSMTGVMEFPNAKYIDGNAWKYYEFTEEDDGTITVTESIKVVDSYFFQNFYSIEMLDVDFKYLHADFGSTVIWPKRFELGYMFPLLNKVVYQNSLGDFDNLGLFGDIKGIWPGVGSIWFSIFIDEIEALKTNWFLKTRNMFAYQAGTKLNIPWLAFTTFSFRYTKVEPYCYTHQAIRKQPWYSYYISESYTNNGTSLGYYLQPNSDEFFVRLDTKCIPQASIGLQYQLIRHGADYGSGQVAGSSIWSEMQATNRDSLQKYFLHDGTYEWSHIIAVDASYIFNQFKVPVQVYGSCGYVYDFFTQSEDGANTYSAYHRINTSEYPTTNGVVFSLGFKVFAFDHF